MSWPAGIALTSWDYMWRSTPMHRREALADSSTDVHLPPAFPSGVGADEVVGQEGGYGPLFHRRYKTRIRDGQLSAEDLMAIVKNNPNAAAPTKFARFQKVLGEQDTMAVGDEYVVRMPGPWDGPVRVVAESPYRFRLATLRGHLEAGQIEFRAVPPDDDHGQLGFEIESWARSSDRLSNLLYHHLRMSKEVQLHMWTSFLEGVVDLSGGRMTGGIVIETWRIEAPPRLDKRLLGPPRVRRKLVELAHRDLNFDLADRAQFSPARGGRTDDRRQALPAEPPGIPVKDGSWEIARRLMQSYAFADPSIVRAFYDPDTPLQGRNMLLELRALGLLHVFVGVRVGEVYDETRVVGRRQARVWGWNYRTLEGHVEQGQMDWEVWKWLDSGEVEFRIHAVSRPAHIRNLFARAGFRLIGQHERKTFLESTERRMLTFAELALAPQQRVEPLHRAATRLTARRLPDGAPVHDELVRNVTRDDQISQP